MAKAKAEKLIKEEIIDGPTKESSTTPVQADSEEQEIAEKVTSHQSPASSEKQETEDKGQETDDTSSEDIPAGQETILAKAGKRSAKALKESEEKVAKEERKAKAVDSDEETKPKVVQKPARTKLERKGKKFRGVAKLIEAEKEYTVKEALQLAVKTSPVKFDASVELHVNLGVDPRQADQNVRDNLVLPMGTGKTIRIAVFAEADDAAKAIKAGANVAGIEEITSKLDKEIVDFDTLIATPGTMARLGKYARMLGPKGLMPNPKSGTVTPDVAKAVTEAKAGRVEYRVDSTGIIHLSFGKVSFGAEGLEQNVRAVLASVKSAKPASIKGNYVKSIHITTSMGPSIKVATSEIN